MSASLAVQRVIHGALATLTGVTGVFDGVPADATAPYLTLGPDLVSDRSHKTGIGHEHRVQINIWDDRPGSTRVKSLAAEVEARLRVVAGTTDGHRIASAVFLRSFVAASPGGWTQGVVEFRIRTEQL